MAAVFSIGYLITAVDLVVGSVDVLPDPAGLACLLFAFIWMLRNRKVPFIVPLLSGIALIFSLVTLFVSNAFVTTLLLICENLAFFVLMLPVFRVLYPASQKGSLDDLQSSALLTGHFLICLIRSFPAFLNAIPALGWVIRIIGWAAALFIVVMICRRWQAHMINQLFTEE